VSAHLDAVGEELMHKTFVGGSGSFWGDCWCSFRSALAELLYILFYVVKPPPRQHIGFRAGSSSRRDGTTETTVTPILFCHNATWQVQITVKGIPNNVPMLNQMFEQMKISRRFSIGEILPSGDDGWKRDLGKVAYRFAFAAWERT